MHQFSALLLVTILSGPAPALEPVRPPSTPSLRELSLAPATGALMAGAAVGVSRPARATPTMPWAQSNTQPQKPGGWIARHPKIFGALVGFGAGCALGASQVGGSEDNFFNALDEFACPTVGGIGAVAGAVVGSLFK